MFDRSFQLVVILMVSFLVSITCENVWLSQSHQSDQSYFSHRFDDSSIITPKKLPVADRLCDEVTFENDNVEISQYGIPACRMKDGDDYQPESQVMNGSLGRSKREIFVRNVPMHFTIPSSTINETLVANSYIQLDVSICADPGAEVLIFDKGTSSLKIIFHYKNAGGTYQCNRLKTDVPNFKFSTSVSESNSIQVEYKLPKSDYTSSSASYRIIGKDSKQGHRVITYSDTTIETADPTASKAVFELTIQYQEMRFEYPAISYLYNPGEESTEYKPNMVKTYVIPKKTDCSGAQCNMIGIEIDIHELDLDFKKGDYLLIGQGNRPNFWSGSPGQIIARKITSEGDKKPKKVYVHTDSAFLMLVTHNSLYHSENALKFSWEAPDTPNPDYVSEETSLFLKQNSIQLCFSGGDCVLWKTTLQYDFIQEAVHIFNKYLITHEKEITTLIGRDSIRLFNHENITFTEFARKRNYCRLSIAIASPFDLAFPLVNAETLKKMFFEGASSRKVLHELITVTDCVYQHISLLSILLPIGLLMTISMVAIFLFWRLQQSFLNSYIQLKK